MMRRVLLLSSVHPATDPRILYKVIPSLATRFEVFCALPDADLVSNESPVTMIRLPKFDSLLARIVFSHPILIWKCIRLRPDLVHIFVPELIPVAYLFRLLGSEVIYEVQENLYKKFQIKKHNNLAVYRAMFWFLDRLARKHFFLIFTEDAYLYEYKSLSRPFAIVHNYVSLSFIDKYSKERKLSDQPTFFYSGVISFERSFDVLVAAVAILVQKYPNIHIHMFGPVRFGEREVSNLPMYSKVSQHFTFYGYTDLKVALMKASEAVAGIALLKSVADYPESLTTKLFEYMALQLPVITSDFPLYMKVLDSSKCGFCISPENAESLAEKMGWLILHKSEATRMGSNGREAAERLYNWEKEEKILLSFYKGIFESKCLAA